MTPARTRLALAARVLFLVAALGGALWALHGRGDELRAAMAAVSPAAAAAALGLVAAGLGVTGWAWLRLAAAYGRPLPTVAGLSVFYVGQLGKYIPGGVWSIGAHAELARRHGLAVRTTAAVSLVFLWMNVATAAAFAGATLLPGPAAAGCLLGAAVAFAPPVLGLLGRRLAAAPIDLDLGDAAWFGAALAVIWSLYGAAVVVLAPAPDAELVAATLGAFAAAYVVGVVVVLAPAGLGAREVTFVAILAPTTGVVVATSLAVLARLLHTVADLALAGTWFVLDRRRTR